MRRFVHLIIFGIAITFSLYEASSGPERTIDIKDLEKSTFDLVNNYRKSKDLPPLKLDPKISDACREHSQDMASGKMKLGHDGFDERVDGLKISYSSAAENVAWNYNHPDPAVEALQDWIKSTGHRKNMEGDFKLTGIGIARDPRGGYYFTQIFIKPSDTD
jgi:uncharacterized protein YkwD